ncbi:hypothetical protein ABK905_06545 [Acerihabitans sp. KWT182]|uniref:Uncharacterized protein n=1 Tax=Acerihabitans sp. KWT182 TaxID=3157919 RepID=A0AAU7QCX6_9GAMM
MSRFSSFKHVPIETRRILRGRFASKLHVAKQHKMLTPELNVRKDEHVLRLLANLKVSSNAEWSTAEVTYLNAKPNASEPADLQTLANVGWLRRIWGRAEIGRELRRAVMCSPAGTLDALKRLVSDIHGHHYEVGAVVRSDPVLFDLIDAIESTRTEVPQIACRTPEWVIAKL